MLPFLAPLAIMAYRGLANWAKENPDDAKKVAKGAGWLAKEGGKVAARNIAGDVMGEVIEKATGRL